MKPRARNSSSLSIVPPATESDSLPAAKSSASLRELFQGWLQSVRPTVLHEEKFDHKPTQSLSGTRPLSSTDLVRLSRATVRESNAHRAWPPEVVAKFLAADVIKRK